MVPTSLNFSTYYRGMVPQDPTFQREVGRTLACLEPSVGEIAWRPLNARLVAMIREIESGGRGQSPANRDAPSAEVFA